MAKKTKKVTTKPVVITPKVVEMTPSLPTVDDVPRGEFFITEGHLYQKGENDECLRVDCGDKEYADDFDEVVVLVDVVITWTRRK